MLLEGDDDCPVRTDKAPTPAVDGATKQLQAAAARRPGRTGGTGRPAGGCYATTMEQGALLPPTDASKSARPAPAAARIQHRLQQQPAAAASCGRRPATSRRQVQQQQVSKKRPTQAEPGERSQFLVGRLLALS